MIRIGGEFELNTALLAKNRKENSRIIYPNKHQIWTDTGRSALFIAIDDILKKGGKKLAWLPIFCCESVILPFLQHGIDVRFYSMGKLLQNFNGSNLNIEDHSIFLFINYFGKENKTVYDWLRAKPAEKVIFIIEDNVQASLSKDMGKYGDYVVNSFRKMTPLPDGAVVASTKKFDFSLQMPSEEFISKKLVAKHIRDDNEQEHIFFVQNSEEMLDQYIEPRRISWISDFLFDRIDLEEIRMLRRTNWNLLKKALIVVLKDKYEIHTLYSSLEPNEIPLGFPIIVNPEIRNKLRAYLAENNIFCPIHWRLPKKYYAVEFKDDFELSESILTLPIDQRMNEEHINYMVEIIIQFFNKIKGETK